MGVDLREEKRPDLYRKVKAGQLIPTELAIETILVVMQSV